MKIVIIFITTRNSLNTNGIKEQQRVASEQHRAESEQQRAAYEELCQMVMNMAQGGTCAPNPFWPSNPQPPPPPPPLYYFLINIIYI